VCYPLNPVCYPLSPLYHLPLNQVCIPCIKPSTLATKSAVPSLTKLAKPAISPVHYDPLSQLYHKLSVLSTKPTVSPVHYGPLSGGFTLTLRVFRDGEQLVNRIPNCNLLTNKLGLFNSLSEYNRVMAALKGDRGRMKMQDFVPDTYRIDQLKDKEAFLDAYKGALE